jgi:hypothetical protein
MSHWKDESVLIVGGGIGGLTAALALERQGIPSQVIEQVAEFKEIGAGIQLGPNVFWMLDRLGLIAPISALAVFPNNLIMRDSITGEEVTRIPLGGASARNFIIPTRSFIAPICTRFCSMRAASQIAFASMPRRKPSRSMRRPAASRSRPRAARPIAARP